LPKPRYRSKLPARSYFIRARTSISPCAHLRFYQLFKDQRLTISKTILPGVLLQKY